MATVASSRVGKRGAVIIPTKLRRKFGIEEGTVIIAEAHMDGVLIRPATVFPVESYSPQRQAEFLLSNATDAKDYAKATRLVRKMGMDPAKIRHRKPRGA